jgi:endoglucanase Acf2
MKLHYALTAASSCIITTQAASRAPLSSVDPQTLIESVTRVNGEPSYGLFGDSVLSKPLPTNAWWENMVLGSGNSVENNVFANPYIVIPSTNGLGFIMPFVLAPNPLEVQNAFDSVVEKVTRTQTLARTRTRTLDFTSLTVASL